jgi:hypothetical protein
VSVGITKKAYEKYGPFSGERGVIYEYDMWLKLGKQQMPIVISKTLSSFRLYSQGFSSTKANLILQDDEYIAKKHTNNKLILLLHRVNNYVRLLINRTI